MYIDEGTNKLFKNQSKSIKVIKSLIASNSEFSKLSQTLKELAVYILFKSYQILFRKPRKDFFYLQSNLY